MDYTASIICMNPLKLKEEIQKLLDLDWNGKLHADIMDGHFVPRLGLYPEVLKFIKDYFGNEVSIDTHLMVDHPLDWIDLIGPYSDTIFFHAEIQDDISYIRSQILKKFPNVKVGLALKPFTFLNNLNQYRRYFSHFLLMGISPGVLGSETYPELVISKAYDLGCTLDKKPIIYVDGAVSFKTLPTFPKCYINTCVVGNSTLYKDDNIINNINELKELGE